MTPNYMKPSKYSSDPLYHTKAWQDVRDGALARDNFLCQHCLKDGKLQPAELVHHIKHLDRYPELGLEPDNLISLCNDCHTRVHKQTRKKRSAIPNRRARIIKG